MEQEKSSPLVAKVFGIINIIYGLILLGLTLFSLFFKEKLSSMGSSEISEQMREITHQVYATPKVQIVFYVSSVVIVILLAILIIAGIKLLKKDLLGRTLSIVYGWCAIGYTILLTLASYLIINPVYKELVLASDIPDQVQKGLLISINVQGITNICCFGLYPIILLIFMTPQKFYNSLAAPNELEEDITEESTES